VGRTGAGTREGTDWVPVWLRYIFARGGSVAGAFWAARDDGLGGVWSALVADRGTWARRTVPATGSLNGSDDVERVRRTWGGGGGGCCL
jgi:hypothetical protein